MAGRRGAGPNSVVSRRRERRRTSAAVKIATKTTASTMFAAESSLNQAGPLAAPGGPATVATERVLK